MNRNQRGSKPCDSRKSKIDTSTTSPPSFELLRAKRLLRAVAKHLEDADDILAVAQCDLDYAISASGGGVNSAEGAGSSVELRFLDPQSALALDAPPAAPEPPAGGRRAKPMKRKLCAVGRHEWEQDDSLAQPRCPRCELTLPEIIKERRKALLGTPSRNPKSPRRSGKS